MTQPDCSAAAETDDTARRSIDAGIFRGRL